MYKIGIIGENLEYLKDQKKCQSFVENTVDLINYQYMYAEKYPCNHQQVRFYFF